MNVKNIPQVEVSFQNHFEIYIKIIYFDNYISDNYIEIYFDNYISANNI